MRISTEAKQSLVARYRAGESVVEICADSGVPRSTFYTWIKPYTVTTTDSGHAVSQQAFIKMKQKLQKLEQKIEILQRVNCTVLAPLQEKLQELAKLHGQYSIQAAFDESQQRFGANKIAAVLADRGVRTSPKYVAELMREMGLQSVSIYSKHDYQKSERLAKKQNMLQRQFKVDEPNHVWVSDITCFKVNGKYLYVCVILDLFSRKVVAHRVSPKNSTYLVTSTFRQAYRNRNEPQQLMFHSDQGPQYTSNTFRKLLRMNKVVQSFSKSGRPHDNAVAESFFASMKREEVYRTQYCSEHQFMRSVDTYIEFYNTKRPHSTLNYKTPDGFELLHEQRRERTG